MNASKKQSELLHPHFVAVRLSDIEIELLDQNASILGVSRSEYLRKLLIEKEICNRIEIVADIKILRKLVSEYGKIGSNLNQIARYFNQGGIISTEMKNEIRKSLRDIYEMKYEVMKMAGDFRGSN